MGAILEEIADVSDRGQARLHLNKIQVLAARHLRVFAIVDTDPVEVHIFWANDAGTVNREIWREPGSPALTAAVEQFIEIGLQRLGPELRLRVELATRAGIKIFCEPEPPNVRALLAVDGEEVSDWVELWSLALPDDQ